MGSGNLVSDLLGDIGELISVSLGPQFPHFHMKVRVHSHQENPDMHKEFPPSAWLCNVKHVSTAQCSIVGGHDRQLTFSAGASKLSSADLP